MNRANRQLTTARNTPRPIFAAGSGDVPASGKVPAGLSSSQGLLISPCCDSHHPAMPAITARKTTTGVTAAGSSRPGGCGLVLRNEVLGGTGHAVVVGPAIHDRQF